MLSFQFLSPMIRAVMQLDDRAFMGVLLRSVAWSVLAFAGLIAFCSWLVQDLVGQPGWLGWVAGFGGGAAAVLLAVWLFVPVAVGVAALYSDRVADAVDRRFYPGLPPPGNGAPIHVQAWDGVALGARVLLLQVVALALALLLPGVGLVLGWGITGWAIGRGLFVAVAMRRMSRPEALAEYARRRLPVLVQGGLLAAGSTVPFLALLVPVVGVAALTHVLNRGQAMPPGTRMLGQGQAWSRQN